MLETIIQAIKSKNRVKIIYGDDRRTFLKLEIYAFGFNGSTESAQKYIRVFDCIDMKFKLLKCEKIKSIELRKGDTFTYLQPEYNKKSDAQISTIILQI